MIDSKRAMLIFLVIIFISGVAFGCETNNGTKNKDLKGSDMVEETKLDEVTLNFYFPKGDEPEHPDTKKIIKNVEDNISKELNTKLNFNWINASEYYNRIREIVSSGNPCDAFYVYGHQFGPMSDDNMLMDITGMFPRYALALYQKYSDEELASAYYNNKLCAIPVKWIDCASKSVIVRKDLMEKYNIPEINTYQDYELYLDKLKQNETDIFPGTLKGTPMSLFTETFDYVILDPTLGLVYRWGDQEMKIRAWEQTNEFKNVTNTLERWYSKGYCVPGDSLPAHPFQLLNSGKLGSMVYNWAGGYGKYVRTSLSRSVDANLTEYILYKDAKVQLYPPIGYIAIGKYAKNPERTLMFIDWVESSQENYDLLMYGIKDENYSLIDGRVGLPNKLKGSAGSFETQWNGIDAFFNFDYYRESVSDPLNFKKDFTKHVQSINITYAPDLGFKINTAPIQALVDNRMRKVQNMEEALCRPFKTEIVDSFITEQKAAGIDNIVSEIQKQLNKWRANNKN